MKNPYNISYSAITSSTGAWPANKALAIHLSMSTETLKLGDFLKSISDDDLKKMVMGVETEDENDLAELYLMSLLVPVAEDLALHEEESDVNYARYEALKTLLVMEFMSRSGVINLRRENITLDETVDVRTFFSPTEETLSLVSSLL